MREPAKDKGRLDHILECINNINEFVEGKTFEQIEGDKMCYFAVVYQLVIIGEAANMLTSFAMLVPKRLGAKLSA